MLLSPEEVKKSVDGIIHEETQFAETGIDLTVSKILKPETPTELDFGGSEESPADLKELSPEKRSEEDKYGWWNLKPGIYIIEFNERITVEEGLGIVLPLNRLTSGGSSHGRLIFTGKLEEKPVLTVSSPGLKIKENARLSRIIVWR